MVTISFFRPLIFHLKIGKTSMKRQYLLIVKRDIITKLPKYVVLQNNQKLILNYAFLNILT